MRACILSILFAAAGLLAGCSSIPTPDPLTGFHFSSLGNLHSNKAITDDYQDYIQKLPKSDRSFVAHVEFFEDGTGQHAVQISQGVNGTWWIHDLIYDKDNRRIKAVTYKSGGYRS